MSKVLTNRKQLKTLLFEKIRTELPRPDLDINHCGFIIYPQWDDDRYGGSACGISRSIDIRLRFGNSKSFEIKGEYRDLYWPNSEVFDNQFCLSPTPRLTAEDNDKLRQIINEFFESLAKPQTSPVNRISLGVSKFESLS